MSPDVQCTRGSDPKEGKSSNVTFTHTDRMLNPEQL